jgi:hypothetical protein
MGAVLTMSPFASISETVPVTLVVIQVCGDQMDGALVMVRVCPNASAGKSKSQASFLMQTPSERI